MKNLVLLFLLICFTTFGQHEKWSTIELQFDGPETSETANPNPFTYYSFTAELVHESGSPVFKIPGFYAANGKSAESSASEGNKWAFRFTPNKIGKWNYKLDFVFGPHAALTGLGEPAGFFHGKKGSFTVTESTAEAPSNRALGRLNYVGKPYLQWEETGQYFIKVGADSPENMLHYTDFDGTLDGYGKLGNAYLQLMKDWAPHASDADDLVSSFTWQNGKGKNLMGAINYLHGLGVNAISFLTFSADGDDGCVYPHLVKNDSLFIAASQRSTSWKEAMEHFRFDVSKLEQWERIFSYAEEKGMFLHFKTFEAESCWLMGRTKLTDDRKIYYRELIARFGHHLALNWNLSEETNVDVELVKETAAYIRGLDPYKHHTVQHTYPKGHVTKKVERPGYEYYHQNLVGFQSELTGLSMQLDKESIHQEVARWRKESKASGKLWAIANDEQGSASIGVTVDASHPAYTGKAPDNQEEIRHKVLWGALMGGAFGVEYYYGYQTEANDLNAQDHRTRENKYKDAVIAKKFFESTVKFLEVEPADERSSNTACYVLASENQVIVYLPAGEKTSISGLDRSWTLQWFNPMSGEMASRQRWKGSLLPPSLNQDWVAVLEK